MMKRSSSVLAVFCLWAGGASCFSVEMRRSKDFSFVRSAAKPMDVPLAASTSSSSPSNPLLDTFGLSCSKSPTALIFPSIIALVACTRPIPFWDRFFSIVYPLYLCLANRFRFDRNAPSVAAEKKTLPLLREGSGPWFSTYLKSFGTVGILLPLVVQILAPRSIVNAAAPHFYLTLCQVVMESFARGPRFYSLTRLLVPIGFNAYRIGALKVWIEKAWIGYTIDRHSTWGILGLVLAAANTLMWTYNIFIFLLLRVLPQYLNRDEFPDSEVTWKGPVLSVPVLVKTGGSLIS
uniref:DUF7733 domain-containing protein n=1 Tax=Proboscia inermis TaxID=420281 RepID=A0A7S0C4K2_9STRA|mmetsp:Transcript_26401/g.26799  ORF Transcript_26401/g.26799 Transcript_26401/m.26799 type:complete len:292 (+) Transcript_26401:66-941(+)